MALSIILKVYDGGKLKLSRAFKGAQVRLGTGDVELQLEGENVASHHALIELGAMGAVLRSSSAAPLFLNGQPILAAPLRSGDLITLGSLRVMCELRDPAQTAPQQPAAPAAAHARPRLQLIQGDEEPERGLHGVPSLAVVREDLEGGGAPATALAAQMLPELAPAPETFKLEPPPKPVTMPKPQAQVAHKPAPEPEPVRVSNAPMAAAGSAADIGFAFCELRWGNQLLGVHCLEPGKTLRAGTAVGCDAFLPGLDAATLVTSDNSGWLLRAPQPVSMSLLERGEAISGHELLARGRGRMEAEGLTLQLPTQGCGVLRAGGLSLSVRIVPEAPAVGRAREDWRGIGATSAVAGLFVAVMAAMHAFLPPPKTPAQVQEIRRPLIVKAAPAPKKEESPQEKPTPQKAQARQDPGKAFARHRGTEGQAGSLTAPRRDARAQKTRDDRAIVAESGLLKAMGKGKGVSDVFGTAIGTGTREALGHLDGPRVGDARGNMGAGLKSLGGTGGGGDGSGLGLARIGTNGIGGGLADYGEGRGALKGKANGAIGLGNGKPSVQGEIDPELIRKVVHDHRAQIRACYEQELNQKPRLAGKLTSAWTIDPQGLVVEAHVAETTLHDSAVEKCVASRIKSWRFPLPKGGGEVFVTYPFLFTRGG